MMTRDLFEKVLQMKVVGIHCPICGNGTKLIPRMTIQEIFSTHGFVLGCDSCTRKLDEIKVYEFKRSKKQKPLISLEYLLPEIRLIHQSEVNYACSQISEDCKTVWIFLTFPNKEEYRRFSDFCLQFELSDESAEKLRTMSSEW